MPLVNRSFPLLLCCALLAAGGCKRIGTGAGSGSSPAAEGPITPIDPATAGNIEGTVHLIGKAPERIEIDMAQDPACAMSPYGKNLTEGIVSQKDGATTGRLANVYVYVKDGLGNKVFAAPTEPAVLDQKGCRYVPHVVERGARVILEVQEPLCELMDTLPGAAQIVTRADYAALSS